jgi:hypothetical protein
MVSLDEKHPNAVKTSREEEKSKPNFRKKWPLSPRNEYQGIQAANYTHTKSFDYKNAQSEIPLVQIAVGLLGF